MSEGILDIPSAFREDDNYDVEPDPENEGLFGLPTRPADVIAAITGGDADRIQERTESAVEGTATGTPPPIGPGAPGAPASVSRLTQALGIGGSFALGNTDVGGDVGDVTDDVTNGELPDGIDIPWRKLGLFALGIVAIQAFASGISEGLTA